MAFVSLLLKAGVLGFILLITHHVLAYLRSPLKKIPGPFLAKFSNIWRLVNHYGQTHIETQKRLHAKYGDVVRLGPTTVSVADPSLLKTIYNTRGTFLKVSFPTDRKTADSDPGRATTIQSTMPFPTGTFSKTYSAHAAMISTPEASSPCRNCTICKAPCNWNYS